MISIGELAARAGVSAATVRYYEHQGLLAPAPRRAGRRVYGKEDVRALRLVVAARRAGFGIAALKSFGLALRSDGEDREQRAKVIATRLESIDSQIDQLTAMRALLATAAACPCSDMLNCGKAEKAMRP